MPIWGVDGALLMAIARLFSHPFEVERCSSDDPFLSGLVASFHTDGSVEPGGVLKWHLAMVSLAIAIGSLSLGFELIFD